MKKTLLTKTLLLLCALVAGSSNVWADETYTKVTSTSDLVAGNEYILLETSGDTKYLANTTYSSSKYGSVTSGFSISGSNVTVTTGTAALVLRLGGSTDAWTLYDVTNKKWVGKASGNTDLAQSGDASVPTDNNGYYWTIKDKSGELAIYSNYKSSSKDHTGRYIGRNNSSIGPYSGASYPACVLYKKVVPPSINASDVNYAADITSGEIAYTVSNPVGGKSMAASSSTPWISNVTVDSENSKVTFDMEENETASPRVGTITLAYGTDLATKNVSVTQAAAVAKYTVTFAAPENGTLVVKRDGKAISSGAQIPTGTELAIEATPARGYSLTKWEYKEGEGEWTDGVGTTYSVDASAVAFRATFAEITKFTVTFGDDSSTLTEEYGGEGVTLPSRSDVGGDLFAGWSETEVAVETAIAPAIIPAGEYLLAANITLYPVFYHTAPGKTTAYKQITTLGEVEEGVYVMGSQKSTSGAALVYMPNTEASGSNPTLLEGLATETTAGVTYLTNEITSDMLWDFTSTGTANQYYIRPHGKTNMALGCTTTTGDKIRISSSYKNMKWTIATSASYNWQFKNDAATAMYLAVYNFYAWRNYDNAATNQNGKFYLYKAVEADGMVNYYTSYPVTSVNATISTAEYATYYNATHALDFSATGIAVYTATDEETKVTLNEVASGKVPANTPVVLYKAGADGTPISVPVIATADAIGGTNDLRVSTGTDVENMYVLAKKPTIGFYPWGGTNLSAGKIYLQGKASYGAREFLGFGNDSETTSLREMRNEELEIRNAEIYNLAGQRVATPKKGLYIVNGKKVIIK